jgi:hypothetical protein
MDGHSTNIFGRRLQNHRPFLMLIRLLPTPQSWLASFTCFGLSFPMLYTFEKELHVSLLYYILTTLLHIGLGMEHRELHELLVCEMKVESILVRLNVFLFGGSIL